MKNLVKVLALVMVVGFFSCSDDTQETVDLLAEVEETPIELPNEGLSAKRKRDSRTAASSGSSAANNYEN